MRNILFIILVVSIKMTMAQGIVVKGSVQDSLKNPLAYANVIAKPKEADKDIKFSITDDMGHYKLDLEKNTDYTLQVSFMGYQTEEYVVNSAENVVKNFILKEQANLLEEVVVELPVSVQGDTITYNTEKFINGKERKLKSVLKKLPGVEVNREGEVTVMGKKVNKILVDGKPFFGGRNTKLAVENIPADAVDKVKAIDNYNEVGFLSSVHQSDEMAMDIRLKEDKKRFVFGDVEAGKGNKKYYKAHAGLYYYSPKTNVNFIGNLNNIGERTFSFRNFTNMNKDINSVFQEHSKFKGIDPNIFMENDAVVNTQRQFGAVNITRTTSSKLDVSGYAIFSKTKTKSLEINRNEYTNFTEDKTNTNHLNNTFGIGNLDLNYTPNHKEKWYFRTQVKRSKNDKNNQILSKIEPSKNHINTHQNGATTTVNQNIEWHKDFSVKHIFSAIADYSFEQSNPQTFWETNRPILKNLIPIVPQNPLLLFQNQENKQHYLMTIFKDFWMLNVDNHIHTTLGYTYNQQFFNTKDAQLLGTSERPFADFGNHFHYDLHDFFIGLHHQFRKGIVVSKQGVYLHRYHWSLLDENQQKWVLLPDWDMTVKFGKSKVLSVRYGLKTDFADAPKLANRFILKSYNSVFKGNEKLENELYHSASVSFRRFSVYRGLYFLIRAHYTKKIKGFRNTVNFEGTNQFLTYELFDNPSERWNFNGRIRKRIGDYRGSLTLNYFNSKFKQKVDHNYTENKNTSYSYEVSTETLFDHLPNIEVGFKQSFGKYTSTHSNSKFVTNEPFVNIRYDFLEDFQFNFDYSRYIYMQKTLGQENQYELANASLSYHKEDSAWTFTLYGNNLLNASYQQSNSFSDYLISDTKTYILPRVVMFSISYKL